MPIEPYSDAFKNKGRWRQKTIEDVHSGLDWVTWQYDWQKILALTLINGIPPGRAFFVLVKYWHWVCAVTSAWNHCCYYVQWFRRVLRGRLHRWEVVELLSSRRFVGFVPPLARQQVIMRSCFIVIYWFRTLLSLNYESSIIVHLGRVMWDGSLSSTFSFKFINLSSACSYSTVFYVRAEEQLSWSARGMISGYFGLCSLRSCE